MTQDAEGLKACPLNCNGRVLHEEIAGRGYRIQCQKCGCALESPTLRFATMLWNDRAPSPVSALVAALESISRETNMNVAAALARWTLDNYRGSK
jgi:hypothetical protein